MLIKALCGLTRVISNVNIPNTAGQIGNLPTEAIVETNAVFGRDSIRPVVAGELPENVLELIMPHVKNHERIYEAATTGNVELVVEAFMTDPLMSGKITEAQARELIKDMMEKTLA